MNPSEGPPLEQRQLALEIFGSNLSLDGQKLSGVALNPWAALLVFNQSADLVPLYAAIRTTFGIPDGPTLGEPAVIPDPTTSDEEYVS